MSSKKIYLIRHGQTKYNAIGIVQGSGIDSDLNELGNAQANSFYSHYKDIPFDKVYTSKLKRSKQSVQKFIDLKIPHEEFEGLNEICWGNREGQKITPEEDKYYHFVLRQWGKGHTDLAIEGGESPEEVQERQKEVLDLILSRENEDTILICMHGRAIRILMSLLLKSPLKDMDEYSHQNLCLYLLEYDNQEFKIIKRNDTTHLI